MSSTNLNFIVGSIQWGETALKIVNCESFPLTIWRETTLEDFKKTFKWPEHNDSSALWFWGGLGEEEEDIKRYLRDFSHQFLHWENGSAEKRGAWRPEVAGQSPNTKDGQRQPTDRLQRPSRSSCYGWGSLCFIHSTIKCTCQGGKLYEWVMQKRTLLFLLCC